MARDQYSLLMYEAKRRPAIKALIDNLANLTVEEIKAAKVPLKWYTQALLDLKGNIVADQIYATTAAIEACIVDDFASDPGGNIMRWNDGTVFVILDRNQQIEIKAGALVWFPNSGGLWLDTIFSKYIEPRFYNCTLVQKGSKREYIQMLRNERMRGVSEMPADSPPSSSPNAISDPKPLFRIQRH